MNLPEITAVERLTLRPGDRLIVRTDEKLTVQEVYQVRSVIRAHLNLPDDVPLVVLSHGMHVEVAGVVPG